MGEFLAMVLDTICPLSRRRLAAPPWLDPELGRELLDRSLDVRDV
jgi:hypothetical protein